MILIFSASADSQSGQKSSRIIGPIVRWFKPDISEATLHGIVTAVRKCAHVTEYAVLAMLLDWAWRQTRATATTGVRGGLFALTVATLYSMSDEVHQVFVPNRGASVSDVLIDMGGAMAGLFLLFLVRRRKKDSSFDQVST